MDIVGHFFGKLIELLWNYNFCKFILIIASIVIIVLIIYRLATCEEVKIGSFILRGKNAYKALKEELDAMSMVMKQKNNLISLLTDFNAKIADLLNIEYNNPEILREQINRMWDAVIVGTVNIIKKSQDEYHRIAIFVPDKESERQLKIYKSCGYSDDGVKHLRLPFDDSFAGRCFVTGRGNYTNDVTKEPTFKKNPKASKQIFSCMCVPIFIDCKPVALLNIDAQNKDAFNDDDLLIAKSLASVFSMIFIMENNLNIDIRKIIEKFSYLLLREEERRNEKGAKRTVL